MSSSRSPASTSPYPPFPPQHPHQHQQPRPQAPSGQRTRSRDALTPPSPAAPPFPSHNSDPTVQTSRSGSGSSGSGSSTPGLFDRWGARLRTSSSAGTVGASSSSNSKVGVGAPGSRVQAPSSMSNGRPLSSGVVSAPPTPMGAPAMAPNGTGGQQGWPNAPSAGRQQSMDPRLQGRHSFSEGQRPPPERTRSQQQLEEELARVERESIRAEEERLRALAEQERQLRLTLAASAHTSEQDRLRAEELARAKLQEEEALRRAMADSRLDSDKGKVRETEAQRKEREELELVMALSLSESRASMGRSKTMTSAQRFAELSRPSQQHGEEDGQWEAQEDRETRRRGKAREDSFPTSSTTAHSLFNNPSDPQPSSDPPSRQPSDPSALHRRSSSLVFAVSNPDPDEAPPAYVYPEHAAELDEPDALIVGPGRPVPSQPQASTSSAPPPPNRPPPPPPRVTTSPANDHSHHSLLPNGPSSSHSHSPHSYYANSPTSFATPSPPLHISAGHPPQSSYYSTAVAAALSPYDPSPQSNYPGREPGDYFGGQRPHNPARDSFLSTASVAGSFESNDSFGSDRTATTGWSGGAAGAGSSPGIVVEEPESEEGAAAEDPFDDSYSQGVAQPSREPSPTQQGAHSNDLFGMLRDRERQAAEPSVQQQPSTNTFAEAGEATAPIHVSWDTDSDTEQEVEVRPVEGGRRGSTSPISPTGTVTSLDSAIRQEQQHQQQVNGRSSLSPSPSPSTATFATSHSSQSIASALTPSFGGFVSTAATNALADEHVLAGVKWGFVEEARKAMHPPLEHEGDFPRAAQLSRVGEGGGDGEFGCFAVEARSWDGLLVYLMWHGNSRLEAAPADLQRDKANRGLSISITLEFYLSFTDQLPRVRVRVDLLPASSSTATSPIATSFNTDPAHPPNIFDPSCPSISLRLPQSALLPIPLSSLASLLSSAHTRSRKVSKQAGSSWSTSALPYAPSSPLAPTRELAYAIDMTKRLNGEAREGDEETAEEVEAREGGLMERLKGRLKRRKKGPGIVKGGADGSEPGGRRLEGTNRLPEGANYITPFVLDERD
ncbi:hypothetical protein BCR35DRAFT_304315 [Leucosporidium creatinivorum]|uniref:Uncharacterized protein n=1 Tax=Leucosporidium creatinivorum TaxID=106004 RepID=A0A1Y2FA40_9BASI|nr:hypothetical protein BCR35DRAFT_304315 [Leucosporidium creatinivorum]